MIKKVAFVSGKLLQNHNNVAVKMAGLALCNLDAMYVVYVYTHYFVSKKLIVKF